METRTYKINCGMGESNDWPFSQDTVNELNSIGYSGKTISGRKISLQGYLDEISTQNVSYNLSRIGGNGFEFTDEYLLTMTENKLSDRQLNSGEEAILGLASALNITEGAVIDMIYSGMMLETAGKMTKEYKEFIDEMRATFDAY
jgi:hypothetical protein